MIEFKDYYKVPINFTGVCKITNDDSIRYFKDGEFHREDGPAVIDIFGKKYWFINGERHRNDGPAVIYDSGYKEWWYKGKCRGTNSKFNIKTWKKLVKELQREDQLKIFI